MRDASGHGACILLTEDDPAVAALLRDAFEPRGYRVWHACDAAETLLLLDEVEPDVIILDLILPDRSGLALCADLRARTDAPIVVCSSTRRRDDVVLALKLGAVDFVAKPFRLAELEARIEVARRRGTRRRAAPSAEAAPAGRQRIGQLVIDRAARQVNLSGQPVHLTPTEYRLLELLAEHAGRAVPTDNLVRAIWGRDDPTMAASLGTHARRLRAKLRDGRSSGATLATVRGFGYRIGEELPTAS